jgi:phosphatidylinositol alpha-1,6-mannosyltransferase
VRLLGRVSNDDLPRLYGCADVYAMLCRNRWAGLEQEGFGIVFLEAAAAAVPQVAGDSGGAAEAVVHGVTGLVVDRPGDRAAVAAALDELLADDDRRRAMGAAGRERAVAEFTYDALAARLSEALVGWEAGARG